MKVYNLLTLILITVLIQSCALRAIDSDYQFGDFTRAAVEDLGAYCRATTAKQRAAARLAFTAATQVPFPTNPCALYERLSSADDGVVHVGSEGRSFFKVLLASASSTATKHAEFR